MKSVLKLFISILSPIIFFSCQNNKKQIISRGAEFVSSYNKELNTTEIFDTLSFIYIPLETNRNCLIGEINKVIIDDSLIFVMDNQFANSLYVFDINGRFISQIGNQGKGNNEYNRIIDFDINPIDNEIIIYDLNRRSLLFFNYQGEFLNHELLKEYCGMTFALLAKKSYAFYLHEKIGNCDWQLIMYKNGERLNKRLFPFANQVSPLLMPDYFSKNDSGIFFIPVNYDEIHRISSEGEIIKVFDFELQSIFDKKRNEPENKTQSTFLTNFESLKVNNKGQFISWTSYNNNVIQIFGNLLNSKLKYGTKFSDFDNRPEEIIGTYNDYFISVFYPYVSSLRNRFPNAEKDDNPGILLFKINL